ncbi:MAG: SGNH/GDSL hydrolase family protein [Leptospiraceae bacterium]|nr:SGNH/GDSL hydrolase family protein [Leptospiraceae bacterium]
MKELILFLKDKSILSAILFIAVTEVFMQLGCYKPFLKKNSYAYSANKITDTAIQSLPTLNPDTIILGTSLAYEGISPEILNQKLSNSGIVSQSLAIPGSELITQELSIRKILNHTNEIKYIIHVNDIQMPWIDRKALIDSTLSMIAEFDTFTVLKKINDDKYSTRWEDYSFVLLKYVAYKRDIGDFFLAPDKRIKDFGKELKNKSIYAYQNEYLPSIALYHFDTLDTCIEKSSPSAILPEGSDKYHRDAVFKTCHLVKNTKLDTIKNEFTDLYKIRLSNIYSFLKSKNIKIINVYPPVPNLLDDQDYQKRIHFWKTEYSDLAGDYQIDFTYLIPGDRNEEYYYDLIHLNKRGMHVFTEALAEQLLEIRKSEKN